MAGIIDLNEIDLPDCKACTDPTKRISGHTFDVEGPGVIGTCYSCENRRCRNKWNEIAKYIMRAEA